MTPPIWTGYEEAMLRDLYGTMTIAALAARLGRPYRGVACKVARMSLPPVGHLRPSKDGVLVVPEVRRCEAGCGRRIAPKNKHGLCDRCRQKHTCTICGKVNETPSRCCEDCLVLLMRIQDAHDGIDKLKTPQTPEKIALLKERIAQGLPLFDRKAAS